MAASQYKRIYEKTLGITTHLPSSFRMLVRAAPISATTQRGRIFFAHPRQRRVRGARRMERWKGGGVIWYGGPEYGGTRPFFFPNLKKGEYPRNEKRRGPLWIRAYAPRTKSRVCVHVRVRGLKRWKRNSSPPYSARQRARSGTQQPNLPFLIRSFERNGDIRRLIHVHVQEFALFFFLWKFILHFLNRRKHLRILIWKNISVYLNNFFKYHT